MLEKCPINFTNIPSSMRQAANDSSIHFVSNLWIPRSNLSKWSSGIGDQQKKYKRTTALNLPIFKKQSGLTRLTGSARKWASNTNSFAQGHQDTMGRWSAAIAMTTNASIHDCHSTAMRICLCKWNATCTSRRLPMQTLGWLMPIEKRTLWMAGSPAIHRVTYRRSLPAILVSHHLQMYIKKNETNK